MEISAISLVQAVKAAGAVISETSDEVPLIRDGHASFPPGIGNKILAFRESIG
jgi:hypothetical protein